MIFYDRETIVNALEFNDNIKFEVINVDDVSIIQSTEIFKNYENFLELYSSFPVLPSSPNTNNPFMEQSFSNIIEDSFSIIAEMCIKKTLPKMKILNRRDCRSNVGQYSKLKSPISSIFPHLDTDHNFQMVCNYWVNVSHGDGTQLWECDQIKTDHDLLEYRNSHFDVNLVLNWFNIEESYDLKKKYFIKAKNNTCIFYFSNILHSPVINEDDKLRCSIVSWYDLVEDNDN